MDIFLALLLGGMALAYICAPLFGGASETSGPGEHQSWHTLEQLEIDRETGKIDQTEYDELKATLPKASPVGSIEALILGARLQKRVDHAIESEVLVARARQQKRDLN